MSEAAYIHAASRLIEQGDPAADGRAFRRCLGQFPTGVAVVTAKHGNTFVGMAVNSFSAVSLDPPLVLWSIRRESGSASAFLEASHFAINVLSADQVETSQLFGASHPDRFNRTAWSSGQRGAPLLNDAIAHLECRREMVYEGGDHLILVGYVEHYARFIGEPLLFAQGQYAVTQNHPSLSGTAASTTEPVARKKESSFLGLLNATNQHLSALFEEHRQAFGVTVASGRVLHRLYESPLGFEELERATYLGRDALEDALRDLVAHGHVLRSGSLFNVTPNGRQIREALAKRATEFTIERLGGISEADIAATKRVLLELQLN